jgi:hypothetical protein
MLLSNTPVGHADQGLNLTLDVIPSRRGVGVLIGLHLPLFLYLGHGFICGYSLFLLLFPLAALACVLHLVLALRKYAFLTHPDAVVQVVLYGNQAIISYRGGKRERVQVKLEKSTVWQSLVILVLSRGKYSQKLVLFPDSTDDDSVRHLRIQLRLNA